MRRGRLGRGDLPGLRSHRLATRTSVLIEDLADEQVALMPPPFPAAL